MLAVIVPGQGWFYRWCLPAGSLSLGSLRQFIPFRKALTLITSQSWKLKFQHTKLEDTSVQAPARASQTTRKAVLSERTPYTEEKPGSVLALA